MRQQPTFNLLLAEENSQRSSQMKRYLQSQCGFHVLVVQTAENVLTALAEGAGVGNGRFHILLLPDALPSHKNSKPIVTLRQLMPYLKK